MGPCMTPCVTSCMTPCMTPCMTLCMAPCLLHPSDTITAKVAVREEPQEAQATPNELIQQVATLEAPCMTLHGPLP